MPVIEEVDDAVQTPTPEILDILKQNELQEKTAQVQRIEITPVPTYCLKLKSSDDKKIFVNVCEHEKLPAPKDQTDEQLFMMMQNILSDADDSTMMDYRVPMSIGEPHVETDKTGALVNCYDVVLNPRFVRKTAAAGSNAHFTFLLHMIYQGLGSKYQIEFRDTWVKLQNKKYFGESVVNTFIADRSSKPRIETLKSDVAAKPVIKTVSETSHINKFEKSAPFEKNDQSCSYKITKTGPESAEIIINNVKNDSLELSLGEQRILVKQSSKPVLDLWLPIKMRNPENCSSSFSRNSLKVNLQEIIFL
jgi:hypothetical protein